MSTRVISFLLKVILSTTSKDNPNDWTVIDSYCRSNVTGMVVEGNTRLKVEFHTDLSGNNTGFEAKIYSSKSSYKSLHSFFSLGRER